MSFHRASDELYIAGVSFCIDLALDRLTDICVVLLIYNGNDLIRKLSSDQQIVSTVVGEPTPGEQMKIHGLGYNSPAAVSQLTAHSPLTLSCLKVLKPPKGQPVNKIKFSSRFTRPTTALVCTPRLLLILES